MFPSRWDYQTQSNVSANLRLVGIDLLSHMRIACQHGRGVAVVLTELLLDGIFAVVGISLQSVVHGTVHSRLERDVVDL